MSESYSIEIKNSITDKMDKYSVKVNSKIDKKILPREIILFILSLIPTIFLIDRFWSYDETVKNAFIDDKVTISFYILLLFIFLYELYKQQEDEPKLVFTKIIKTKFTFNILLFTSLSLGVMFAQYNIILDSIKENKSIRNTIFNDALETTKFQVIISNSLSKKIEESKELIKKDYDAKLKESIEMIKTEYDLKTNVLKKDYDTRLQKSLSMIQNKYDLKLEESINTLKRNNSLK